MEASRFLEDKEKGPHRPDLTVIVGGLAVEGIQGVDYGIDLNSPEDEFKSAIHGLIEEGSQDPDQLASEREKLMAVREALSTQTGVIARQMHELSLRFDELNRRKIFVSGYLRDRTKV